MAPASAFGTVLLLDLDARVHNRRPQVASERDDDEDDEDVFLVGTAQSWSVARFGHGLKYFVHLGWFGLVCIGPWSSGAPIVDIRDRRRDRDDSTPEGEPSQRLQS